MSLTVEWIPASKEVEMVVPAPNPAKLYIPQWYKDAAPPATEKNYKFQRPGVVGNLGLKACVPLLDSITHGYIQESWTDIYFKVSVDGEYILDYSYPTGPRIIGHRDNNAGTHFKIPDGYYKNEFVWREPWIPKLPKGYSVLYINPLNNFDLPFLNVSGLVDADVFYHEFNGQNPFLLKKGFSGILPAGTPMYQMIFIKRSDWESKVHEYDEKTIAQLSNKIRRHMSNGYRKFFWQKKRFN